MSVVDSSILCIDGTPTDVTMGMIGGLCDQGRRRKLPTWLHSFPDTSPSLPLLIITRPAAPCLAAIICSTPIVYIWSLPRAATWIDVTHVRSRPHVALFHCCC